jgi:hypothetical protein
MKGRLTENTLYTTISITFYYIILCQIYFLMKEPASKYIYVRNTCISFTKPHNKIWPRNQTTGLVWVMMWEDTSAIVNQKPMIENPRAGKIKISTGRLIFLPRELSWIHGSRQSEAPEAHARRPLSGAPGHNRHRDGATTVHELACMDSCSPRFMPPWLPPRTLCRIVIWISAPRSRPRHART